jgi:hypothetical protein
MIWRANTRGQLNWTDMITSRNNKVSLTKLLQLVGGITGTWIMIFMTLDGKLSSEILMIYLTYVGAIEGWSKFVAAKYGAAPAEGRDRYHDQQTATDDSDMTFDEYDELTDDLPKAPVNVSRRGRRPRR